MENQNKTNTQNYLDALRKQKNIEKTREERARLRSRFDKHNRPTKEFYKYEKTSSSKEKHIYSDKHKWKRNQFQTLNNGGST